MVETGRRCRYEAVGNPRGYSGEVDAHRRRYGRPRFPRRFPRHRPLWPRPLSDHVHQPALDDPPVRRVLNRRGFQRLLPSQPRRRSKGPLGRLRSCHPPRLRLGSPARDRRCRHGRRRDRLHLRHANALCRHTARPDVRVDDHERCRAPGALALHRRRRGTGRAAGKALRHDPERHPQGIHGAEHLHLSAPPLDADHLRHLRLHLAENAEIHFDLDLRLPHAGSGSDGGPRTCLHPRRRRRIHPIRHRRRSRCRQVRTPPVLLLGDRHELLHGGRKDARRAPALGEASETVRPEERQVALPAHTFADLWLVADRTRRLQQRDPHLLRGDGGRGGADPVPTHKLIRRSARASHRFLRPHQPQHADLPAARRRRMPYDRPMGRLLLRRTPHLRPRPQGLGSHPGSGRHGRHGEGY